MSLLSCASSASVWRGYDYYEQKKVHDLEANSDSQYMAAVDGSGRNRYGVMIDIAHHRKSMCTCPHADGKRIICKHMVAVFFTVFPGEAQKFYDEAMAYQEEEERRQDELEDKLIKYVSKMKKAELQQKLLELLFDGPEWQFERFLEENWIE